MKNTALFIVFYLMFTCLVFSQGTQTNNKHTQDIHSLIASYTEAREKKDSLLLNSILTTDIDQLVSSGVWRRGKQECMKGMMRSSTSNPGSRSIKVETIRFLNSESVIADARYEIQNADGSARKMWSTFMVVYNEDRWKIAAIRNMLPAVRH